jgi:hypothetical protein
VQIPLFAEVTRPPYDDREFFIWVSAQLAVLQEVLLTMT